MRGWSRVAIWTENLVFVGLLVLMCFLAFLLIQGKSFGESTPAVGGYKLMIVLSGSMNPTFDTGAMVTVKNIEPRDIELGDIITYRDTQDAHKLITHRVIEVKEFGGEKIFITKGDANDIADYAPVPGDNVIGEVTFSLPYVGHIINFIQSKVGVILLIVFPLIISMMGEVWKILKCFKEEEGVRKREELKERTRRLI